MQVMPAAQNVTAITQESEVTVSVPAMHTEYGVLVSRSRSRSCALKCETLLQCSVIMAWKAMQ